MKGLLRSLADGINRLPEALPDEPMLVYGTGSRGKAVEAFLVDRGDDVPDFTEAATSDRDSWRQWRIRTRFDWTREKLPTSATGVLAIHNHRAHGRSDQRSGAQQGVQNRQSCRVSWLFDSEFSAAYWLFDLVLYGVPDE